MKKKYWSPFILGITFFSFCVTGFCQANEDSVMMANSERWEVKQHKGLFGLCKPEFGNFTTIDVGKINSLVIKKKTKDGTALDYDISRAGVHIEQSKFLIIEKAKAYKLRVASDTDTTEAVFSISSISREKRQTFLSKMLSKNNEGKDMTLSYDRDIKGIIINTGVSTMQWEFFIENFTSGSRATSGSYTSEVSISGGYLKNDRDFLSIMYTSSPTDLTLVNARGEHIAGLNYKQKTLYIWIRNDIESSYRKAIAALFAVIIGVKDS